MSPATTRPRSAARGTAKTPQALARRLRELGLHDHAEAIAPCWHITLHDMFDSLRRPAPAAQEAFYRHLREFGWSYLRIGAVVGRDPSTISDACRAAS